MTENAKTAALKIEMNFDFTTERYWSKFWERAKYKSGIAGLGVFGEDPDSKSKALAEIHAFLWSRKTGNIQNPSEKLDLIIFEDKRGFYLKDKNSGIEFSSDTLVNGYRWERIKKNVLDPLAEELGLEEYRKMQETFIRTAYTIGGMIIFPRRERAASINCARGLRTDISDRVDLTIECIRRYFFKEKNPLFDVFEKNNNFFSLFGTGIAGFKAYTDFFFLNDIVSQDYMTVDVFIGKNDFSQSPAYPQSKEEWLIWKEKSSAFIKARNNRIRKALLNGTVDKQKY